VSHRLVIAAFSSGVMGCGRVGTGRPGLLSDLRWRGALIGVLQTRLEALDPLRNVPHHLRQLASAKDHEHDQQDDEDFPETKAHDAFLLGVTVFDHMPTAGHVARLGRAAMNRHQRRLRAKAKPVRLPLPESDDYKVLRALVAQMPMIHQAAALEQIDVLEAAEGMLRLIELGHFRLFVHADGGYELVATDGMTMIAEEDEAL
jgi:hypothetical protein